MSLNKLMEAKQTELLNNTGAFFAFSDSQLAEQAVPGTKYVNLGAGLICPEANAKAFREQHDAICQEAIQQDLQQSGKERIIRRELGNYECWWSHDLEDAIDALSPYGFTSQDVREVFNKYVDFETA